MMDVDKLHFEINNVKQDNENEKCLFRLRLPVDHANRELVKLLFQRLNLSNKNHVFNALHAAAQKGYDKIVKVLLEHGMDVNCKQERHYTALQLASFKGHYGVVKILMEFGAEVNFRDDSGRSALHSASLIAHKEIVKLLLENGADLNAVDHRGSGPLDVALYHRKFSLPFLPTYHKYVCGCDDVVEILQKHIAKRKAANLYVSERNMRLTCSISPHELKSFHTLCEAEIKSMRHQEIKKNISYFDILTKDANHLAVYVRDTSIAQVVQSSECKTKFPIYAAVFESQVRIGIERNELLANASESLNSLLRYALPDLVTQEIFKFLSRCDLINLVNAYKHWKENPRRLITIEKVIEALKKENVI